MSAKTAKTYNGWNSDHKPTWESLNEWLGAKDEKKIANLTTVTRNGDYTISIRYRNNAILTFDPILPLVKHDTCGWDSTTTRARLNQFGYLSVYMKHGLLYFGKDTRLAIAYVNVNDRDYSHTDDRRDHSRLERQSKTDYYQGLLPSRSKIIQAVNEYGICNLTDYLPDVSNLYYSEHCEYSSETIQDYYLEILASWDEAMPDGYSIVTRSDTFEASNNLWKVEILVTSEDTAQDWD